jgi:hypothetical protein
MSQVDRQTEALERVERRIKVLGLEAPPADELMPGPISRRAPAST